MIGRAVRKSRRVLTVSEAVKREIVSHVRLRGRSRASSRRTASARRSRRDGRGRGGPLLPLRRQRQAAQKRRRARRCVRANVDGALARSGRRAVRALPQSRERVVVTGFVDDAELAALYRGAIALVMPSREEGFGLPALEAMACGCAVITSNARGARRDHRRRGAARRAGRRVARRCDAAHRIRRIAARNARIARHRTREKRSRGRAARSSRATRIAPRSRAEIVEIRGTDVEQRVSITIFINNCLTI